MKKLFTLFLFALLAITSAWAADELFYTLECVKNGSNSGYAKYYDVESNGMTWNAPGNQNFSGYWRIGGNSFTNEDRDITATSPMGAAISKITVSHNGYSGANITLNSVKLTVSSDKDFANIIETVTINSPTVSKGTAGTFDFAPSAGKTWGENAYYKISFNITVKYTTNRGIDLTKIEFFKSSTPTTPTLSFGADWDGKTITKYIGEAAFPVPLTMTPEVSGASISYTSTNDEIATWEDSKLAYGTSNSVTLDLLNSKQPGQAKLTASYDGYKSASFTIDLQNLPDPTFSVTPGSAVVAGTEVTITAPTNCTISYYVNDGAVQSSTTNTIKLTINEATTILACSRYQGAENTIESEGAEASYTIKTLNAIEITGNPIKTTYAPGEAFDLTGLKVTPKYSDGSTSPAISGATMTFSPATFASGDKSVTVTATYGELTATKAFDVTVAEASTNTFTLVTSVDQLSVGDQVIFSNIDHANLMGLQKDNNRGTVDTGVDTGITWNDDYSSVTVSNNDVAIATLEAGTKEGTFAFKVKEGYLYAASSSSNHLKTKESKDDDNASATISISSKEATVNQATITFQGDNTRNKLRYNSSSKLFSCYESGQQAVLIYKAGTVVAAPTFNPVSGTAFDTETATVTITAPEGCTLKYTVGSGAEQTSASNTAEVTVSPTAYTITAKSVDAEGEESKESNAVTATYTFTPHVKNIAEFLALEANTTAIFDNSVVVLYDYSQPATSGTKCEYIWVKDESGQTNLYLPVAFDVTNHVAHYENGDVIPAGFKATKNLYDKGNFYQALVDATNKATLKDATLKRLADPVTITFSQFAALTDADLAEWNNTYVMIPRVKFTQKSGLEYNVSQDNTPATSSVFYNKYSNDGAKKKDGTSAVVVMPDDGASVEYNVYGILQVFGTKWEIMPIRFVEYSAQTVTLKELVELGNANSTKETTEYTILNDLRGVRALPGNVILAKDENGNAVDKVTPAGNSFMINAKSKFDDAATEESVNAKAQEDYDQSNWVEIVLPSSVSAADYVDRIITGLSVKGYYKNTTNPRLEASAAPTAGGATGAYTRNAMCPANFMGTSQKCNDETLTQEHGDFFFMTPKPNECVQVVWAVYNSEDGAFYIPAKVGSINSHGFKGAFSINWAYNAGGKITNLTDGTTYQFAAVVKKPEATAQSTKRKVAYDGSQDLSKDYVVYPLNLDANTVTGITETTGAKTVKSVRYFNIMGVELAEPTAGVNIVLTTYTDGTTHSQKILK